MTYLLKFEPKTNELFDQDEFIIWLSEEIKRDVSVTKDAHENEEGLIEIKVEIQEPIVEVADMVKTKDKYNYSVSRTHELHTIFNVG